MYAIHREIVIHLSHTYYTLTIRKALSRNGTQSLPSRLYSNYLVYRNHVKTNSVSPQTRNTRSLTPYFSHSVYIRPSGKSCCRSGQCFQLWFFRSPSSSVLFTRRPSTVCLSCWCLPKTYSRGAQLPFLKDNLQSLRNLVSPANLSGRNSSHGLGLRLGLLPVHRLLDSSVLSHSLWAASSCFLLPFWPWQRACVCSGPQIRDCLLLCCLLKLWNLGKNS